MGFFLIVLVVGVLLFGLSLYGTERGDQGRNEVLTGLSIVGIVVGVVMVGLCALFFLCVGIDKVGANVNLEKLKNERGKYVRLLNEDYNAGNLSVALDFNEKHKLCQFRESTFMWSHFNTDGVCADTIPIPTGKFMPTQKISISADTTAK